MIVPSVEKGTILSRNCFLKLTDCCPCRPCPCPPFHRKIISTEKQRSVYGFHVVVPFDEWDGSYCFSNVEAKANICKRSFRPFKKLSKGKIQTADAEALGISKLTVNSVNKNKSSIVAKEATGDLQPKKLLLHEASFPDVEDALLIRL